LYFERLCGTRTSRRGTSGQNYPILMKPLTVELYLRCFLATTPPFLSLPCLTVVLNSIDVHDPLKANSLAITTPEARFRVQWHPPL
jgi:hypothetical protein